MKKRGIFSLVVLLALSTLFAAQTTNTNIGTAYELVISDVAFAQAETNNSSSVSVITRAQIEAYNAQSTAELVNKAIGTNFNSYGGFGALQTVVIRGASSSKNLIFLDGVSISSAHEGEIDLALIPVSSIERIEIVKSGSGNLGKTNAIGGMVNIITRQGELTEKPFSLSVENGSFIPEAYGTSGVRNVASLSDSHKYDLSYNNMVGETKVAANLGSVVAQNAYTYDGTTTKDLRKHNELYTVYGGINARRGFGENINASSSNLANYKYLNLPGTTGSPSTTDYQEDILFSTKNSISFSNLGVNLENLKADINYSYAKTYSDRFSSISIHNKNKGNVLVEGVWNFGDAYNVVTGADFAFDYVDSTKLGKELRFSPTLYANASIYLLEGVLSLHPSANLIYISDREALSPNASFGAIFNLGQESSLKANVSYAENTPNFSQLYWPLEPWGYSGNINLKTEKGVQGDFGFSTKLSPLTYEGTIFGRNIYNAIQGDAPSYIPYNVGHSVYFGTEQAITLDLNKVVALSASYQYNKSYDLSSGQTFSDNVEVSNVRKHTGKASASFVFSIFDAVLSGEYLGKTSSATSKNIFVANLSINAQVTEDFKVYVAVDNLLNASYELSGGYPMPGTKIRLGGKLKF